MPTHRSGTWFEAVVTLSALLWLIIVPVSGARGSLDQQVTPLPEVYAEAVGQANLRGGPGLDYPVVGQIAAGTRYRVLSRHALVPWLELEYPPVGPGDAWVYSDLVNVTGPVAALPAVSSFAAAASPTPAPPAEAADPPATATDVPASPAPTLGGPIATTLGEANIRYGPGLEYPAIGKVGAGETFRVLRLHALVPWVQIDVPGAPGGTGWIFRDVIEISGDTSQMPVTDAIQFAIPELTPTPQTVIVSGAPWNGAPLASGALATTLGEQMNAYLLSQGFAPYSDRLASVFVLDLQTGDTFTLNDGVAYSGMSLTKIPILVTYFQRHSTPLTHDEAFLVADTMMCSENITTNQLLAQVGDSDALRGAGRVTALAQSLNLRSTFIMRPYVLDPDEPPISGIGTVHTGADQTSALPDAYNQILPQDLGWLLAGIYQCAQNETGLLVERYPNEFNAQECRQMLYAMDANQIGVFTEAGVPAGTRVIHKHGWINDTHGDAALIIGPHGAYVFVAVLHSSPWLEFENSSPIIAELSRMVWNTFNPDVPIEAIHPQTVPATCDPRADPVMDALMSSNLPMPGPAAAPAPAEVAQ